MKAFLAAIVTMVLVTVVAPLVLNALNLPTERAGPSVRLD